MKRLLLILGVALTLNTYATDDTFQFVDADGNVIADGDTLNISSVEFVDDGLDGYYQISSGLYVKNTTSEAIGAGVDIEITRIDNGYLSVCFPANCFTYNTIGTYSQTDGEIAASTSQDFMTEWLMDGYGQCSAVFTLTVFDISYNKYGLPTYTQRDEDGPTVVVNFIYADPSGIKAITSTSDYVYEVARYTLSGRAIGAPQKGLNIVKYSDGSVRKVIVKY